MKIVVRIIAGLMGLLLFWAGFLNLNDPDPLLWATVYGAGAFFAFAAAAGVPRRWPAAALGAITAVWAIYLATIVFGGGPVRPMFPDNEQTGSVLVDTEEGREMGGLAIIALTMFGVAASSRLIREDAAA